MIDRPLVIGSPWPDNNFFTEFVKDKPQLGKSSPYYRKVVFIKAEETPNLKIGLSKKETE